jgi:hypothetical protein
MEQPPFQEVIGCNIDFGSTADITVNYNSNENWYLVLPPRRIVPINV